MSEWFKPVKVISKASILRTYARNEKAGRLGAPRIRGVRLVDLDSYKYPRVGVQVMYVDRIEVFYTTRDLIKIFDVDKSTVYKWQRAGLIPPPFFTKQNKFNTLTPYYIRPQLVVVAKVINDLRRQGLQRFTKEKIKHHVNMVKIGNGMAVKKWQLAREHKALARERRENKIIWLSND